MADTFWTIECGGVEQTTEDWEVSNVALDRNTLEEDHLTFVAQSQDIDVADLFPYLSEVIVRRDRSGSGTSFSGGVIYFRGTSLGGRRIGAGNNESAKYVIAGPWWWLRQDCYEQLIPPLGGWTTHVVLNLNATTAVLWSIRYQLIDILDDALSKYGPIFQFDAGELAEYGSTFAPSDEKRDLTHAEALKSEFKWSPRTVSWFDYSVTPPFLHMRSAINLAETSLDLLNGATVTSADIVPRYDLQVNQVVFRYEQTNTIGNNSNFVVLDDVYPATTTAKTGKMRASMNLSGTNGTEQEAPLVTRLLSDVVDTQDFWFEKHPDLADKIGLVIHDVKFMSPSTHEEVTPYDYEILEGTFHKWMRVGNSNAGAPGAHKDVYVEALADYTDTYGGIVTDEVIKVKVKTTNLATNTYTRIKISSWAEPVPVLAEYFYNLLKDLPWEGEVEVEDAEVSTQRFLGCRLNLTNGLPAWATMRATVQHVREDVDAGRVTVKFGANKWLSPEEIIDLLSVTRQRQMTFYSNAMISAAGANDSVESPDATGKENSVKGQRELNKAVISYTNPDDATDETKMWLDAINQSITLQPKNPDNGGVQISLADLRANHDLNP